MEQLQDPEFLNLDLDVESKSELTALASHLEGRLIALYDGEIGNGLYRVSFEIDPRAEPTHSPESYAEFIVGCIQSLPSDLRNLWDNAQTREFDFGFGSGIVPPPHPVTEGRILNVYRTEISPKTAMLIGGLNASLKITIYPYQPSA